MTTQKEYEMVARALCEVCEEDPDKMETIFGGDKISAWRTRDLTPKSLTVSRTKMTLEEFLESSKNWAGSCIPVALKKEIKGIYWHECQPAKGLTRGKLCVINCGDYRLVFQY